MSQLNTTPGQAHRKMSIGTNLGPDVLLLGRMRMTDQLGRLFHADLDLYSEDRNISFDGIIGDNATVRLLMQDETDRHFNFFVSQFSLVGFDGRFVRYRMIGRPWLWLLTRASDCRIFQNKSVKDIIKEVFDTHGFSDLYDMSGLSGTYDALEYVVQYRETDFNFVSRLMEQYGIYYYFKHENGKHTMMLADDLGAHDDLTGGCATIEYYQRPERGQRTADYIWDWRIGREVQTTAYLLNDFDPLNPKSSMVANAAIPREHPSSKFEFYDYPGEYVKQPKGADLAKVRIEELQAAFEVAHATGNARGMGVGGLFKLDNFPREDQNRKYLITSATHELFNDDFQTQLTGSAGGAGTEIYVCHAAAVPEVTPYRTPRTTPKPVIQGPQTAIVTGPAGEEIWTDEHGRVKVQFHWDLDGKQDENTSCWVRVSQFWAGKNWGALFLPRIGQEVIIEFLEGDPDRPIITGRVYNGESKPPYALPDEKNVSTLKTNSTKGGGGCNEIRFDDTKGEEQLLIQAQKRLDVNVKGSRFESVGGNRNLRVGGDKMELVKGSRHTKVETDDAKDIDGDKNMCVLGLLAEAIQGDHTKEVGGKMHYHVTGPIVLESDAKITLKVGGTYVALDSSGVTAEGPTAELKGTSSAEVSGPTVDVKADGTCTVKGAMVQIN